MYKAFNIFLHNSIHKAFQHFYTEQKKYVSFTIRKKNF